MDEQLKQIGERLRGLRDVLDLTAEEVAETCGIDVDVYEKIERGEVDIDWVRYYTLNQSGKQR